MTELIKMRIDGRGITVEKGVTILQAASILGIGLPTFCYEPRLRATGSCRVCMVELQGSRFLVPACATKAEEGMVVYTNSQRAVEARRMVIELLMSDHPTPCDASLKAGGCSLEKLAVEYGVLHSRFPRTIGAHKADYSNHGIAFDPRSCILCHRCIRACNELQVNEVVGLTGRSFKTKISFDFDEPMGKSSCVTCGECAAYCPTGALMEKSVLNRKDLLEELEMI